MLAFPVVIGSVVTLRITRGYLVKRVEGLDPLIGRKVLNMQAAIGRIGQVFGQPLSSRTQAWEIARPSADHDDFSPCLDDCRCSKGACCDGRSRSGFFQKIASFHGFLLNW